MASYRLFFLVCSASMIFGCASPYQAPASDSLAKMQISAPNLEGEFLAMTSLKLFVDHANPDCSTIKLGAVKLDPSKRSESFYVDASQRAYIRLSYDRTSLFYSRWGNVSFSFVPEKDKEYSLQYMDFQEDNRGHIEANLFEVTPSGELTKIKMDKYASCSPKTANKSL